MMNQALAYNDTTYQEEIHPIRLTIMVYDSVIRNLHQAKNNWIEHLDDRAIDRNQQAQDLITELLLSLDYEQGGDIAKNLGKLYDFSLRQLVGIGSNSNPIIYDNIIKIFTNLRDAWIQIENQQC